MVGFYTYDLVPNGSSASFGLGEISRGKGRYSVVSDRAAFVHRSYLTSISAKAATDAASEWEAERMKAFAIERLATLREVGHGMAMKTWVAPLPEDPRVDPKKPEHWRWASASC